MNGCVKNPWNVHRLFGRTRVFEARLDNGMTVIVSPMPGSPVAAVQMWYSVGSAHEDPRATGRAHFLEHMMFKGTPLHPEGEFDRVLECLGAAQGTNAFTWKDYTAYVVELPAAKVATALELEADRMRSLSLDPDSVHRERGVILDEWLRSRSDPESRRFDSVFSQAFGGSGMAWPILGEEEHLRELTPRSLRDFYEAHYRPSRCALVVVGGVEPDEILSLARDNFIPRELAEGLMEPPRRVLRQGRHLVKDDVSMARLDLLLDASGLSAHDGTLLTRWLSGSDDSLLDATFVLTGRAQEVHAWHCEAPGRDGAVLMISATLPDSESPQEFERDLLELLSSPPPLTELELQSLNVALECHGSSMVERHEERASSLGQKWVYGEPYALAEFFDSRRLISLASSLKDRSHFMHLTEPT